MRDLPNIITETANPLVEEFLSKLNTIWQRLISTVYSQNEDTDDEIVVIQEDVYVDLEHPFIDTLSVDGETVSGVSGWNQEAYQRLVQNGTDLDEIRVLSVTEDEMERWEQFAELSDGELAEWLALGFSVDDAIEWVGSTGVRHPAKAYIMTSLGYDQTGILSDESGILQSVWKTPKQESTDIERVVSVLSISSATNISIKDANEWYKDNWSIESAIKHIDAGRSIAEANEYIK